VNRVRVGVSIRIRVRFSFSDRVGIRLHDYCGVSGIICQVCDV